MIVRYWGTIRHLRAAQIAARVKLRGAARLRRLMPARTAASYARRASDPSLRLKPHGIGAAAADGVLVLRRAIGDTPVDIEAGRFTFLDASADLGWPPDWTARGQSQLWRYHLHYFDMLGELQAPEGRAAIEDWIRANPIHGRGATPDAWHPYVASLRLVNWLVFLSRGGDIAPSIARSLAEHALFIERNLETDVGGNHLLKNLKAMVFAGCAFEGEQGSGWRARFSEVFAAELERQLLADGGHYELSPMYHSQVMADAIETALALDGSGEPAIARIDAAIARMSAFLDTVTHPDGGIALFNDSAFGMTPPPRALHDMAARVSRARASAPDVRVAAAASGYVSLPANNPARLLIADAGKVCPDDLPAHAHADLLSYELSVDGLRMIVDSGVGEYAAGEWRDYYRSTRAHNTVSVDGAEQSECWGSFRVGRRAQPVDVGVSGDDARATLEAGHTGFAHLSGGVMHRRRFAWNGTSWKVDDRLTGRGAHEWASFCHVHPDARIIMVRDAAHAIIERNQARLEVRWHGFAAARVLCGARAPLQGWYADRFGAARPAQVLVLEGRGALPADFGYSLTPR